MIWTPVLSPFKKRRPGALGVVNMRADASVGEADSPAVGGGLSGNRDLMAKRQLDILALEPFYGGVRKAVVEAVTRYSRHRWTVLKLPARKMERRLAVAATWFGEHLSRNGLGKFDVLVTSEAINLADLFRIVPELARKPSVVYFHDNQLPDPENGRPETPVALVNLNSAMAASEVWFNSMYNLRTFLGRASGMVARHGELAGRNPLPGLTGKSHLMPPPIELGHLMSHGQGGETRNSRALLIDAREAEAGVLSEVMTRLAKRKEAMTVCTIGRVKSWPDGITSEVLRERDDAGHVNALKRCGVFVSLGRGSAGDDLALRSLAAGCYPVFPEAGMYSELVPEEMHAHCLHDGSAQGVAERIMDAWYVERPLGFDIHVGEVLERFDAMKACRGIDERLELVAGARTAERAGKDVDEEMPVKGRS